jgi:hypothetical protein
MKDPDALEAGVIAGQVDCDSCEVMAHMRSLDYTNQDAWSRYRRLTGHQVIWDAQAGAWWLAHVTRDVDPDDLEDVVSRMDLLYRTFHPPKSQS